MAEKVSAETARAMKAPTQSATDGAVDELAMLYPDQEIEIAGETIFVREFRYLEGLKARALARPFLNELRDIIGNDNALPSPEALADAVAHHGEIWCELMASVCGEAPPARKSADWVAALSPVDAAKLEEAFWRANGFFFVRRLLVEAATAAAAARLARSRTSSSISSAPASDATSTTSPSASPGDKSSTTLHS